MVVSFKYLSDMLLIETEDIYLEDLFYYDNHLSIFADNIKDHIRKAHYNNLEIKMDVTSSMENIVPMRYLIQMKNNNLDYLSDIDFTIKYL